jgi:hypothetical protein
VSNGHASALARGTLPPVILSDGSVEALKWLGIVLMTVDHANKYLNGGQFAWMFDTGRIVMPLFGFVLAYNLSRPGALVQGMFQRVSRRLLIYGAVATIPFIGIHGPIAYGLPLNILFMLLLSTGLIWLLERRSPRRMMAIVPLFVIGGLLPEFWHFGTAATIAAWYFCKNPRVTSLALWIVTLVALFVINQNFYALLVIPLIYAAQYVDLRMPRYRHVFYVFYPAHLAVIWLLQTVR